MNENIQSATKRALIYGFIGAAVFPLIYECYANVMQGIALFFAAAGCIFFAVKMFPYKFREAFAAIAFFIVISAGFGIFLELVLHDSFVSYLESHSQYFYMSVKEVAYFAVKIFVCYMLTFLAYAAKAGICLSIKKIKSNGEATASDIENAFNDGD